MPDTSKKATGDSREKQVHTLVREFYEIRKSQEIQAIKPPPPLRRRPIVAVCAMVLFVAAWVTPIVIARGSDTLSAESLDRNARLSIYVATLTIRGYEKQSGRVPATASEARLEDSTISYVRLSDSTFELSKPVGDGKVSYHSASDIASFLRSDSVLARKR